ncbi:MAG: addiction module protein [Propionibacteriaceae bacterium]|jgi:putative addiction module component (TIGR02574 family)|nr:addiction module protein [Propionibacteriaceae bacterium]
MVSPALQESLASLTTTERVDIIDFLQRSLVPAEVTDAERETIRRRDAELAADPSIGLTWEELDARLQSQWG